MSILFFSVFQIYLFLEECQVDFLWLYICDMAKKWTIKKLEKLIKQRDFSLEGNSSLIPVTNKLSISTD
jgi:hypothetical protein